MSCERAARTVGALLTVTGLALVGTACSESRSASSNGTTARAVASSSATHATLRPSSTTATTTDRSAPLSTGSFFVEPCVSLVGSPPPTTDTDLRPFLLGAAQFPVGALIDGPHQTSTTGPKIWASVPSTSPAAYEDITLSSATQPGGTSTLSFDEVIGDVGSASFAGQLLAMLDSDLDGPDCNPRGTDAVALPGTSPPISAFFSSGQASSGSVRDARLFAAKGSRLLCLTWTSNVAVDASGLGPVPNLPALPDVSAMAQVLNTALALIPS
jgi:hypothetical protein